MREERHVEFEEMESFVEVLEPEQPEFETVVKPPAEVAQRAKPGKVRNGKRPVRARDFLDGSILVRDNTAKQLPFILFLTFLAIIYIGNRYHAESMVRKINALEMEVKNLRSEQITTTSELMNISKPSTVSAIVSEKNLGLKQSVEPPKKLIRKKGI